MSDAHTASVNGVAFAPHELGLMLAAASSDGSISVLSYMPDGTWALSKVHSSSDKCLLRSLGPSVLCLIIPCEPM